MDVFETSRQRVKLPLPSSLEGVGLLTAFSRFIELYFLGDRFRCNPFKNWVMDLIQGVMRDNSEGKKFGQVFTYRQIKSVLTNTISTTDSPLRKFCAASISYYLRQGGMTEKVSKIFTVEDFVKEFFEFQAEVWKKADTKGSRYDKTIGLRSDPRIRKEETQRCGESYCSDCITEMEGEEDLGDEAGFPICFFHVHEKDDKCASAANYNSDCLSGEALRNKFDRQEMQRNYGEDYLW